MQTGFILSSIDTHFHLARSYGFVVSIYYCGFAFIKTNIENKG